MANWPNFSQLLSAGQRAAAKRGAKLTVLSGASGRCRCCTGPHVDPGPHVRPLGPYIGLARHITGGGLGNRTLERYCWDILVNDPTVPFKVQWAVGPGGKEIALLGVGRANHALNMSQAAYNAFVQETWSLTVPWQNLRGAELVGSTHLLGIEQVAAVAPDAEQAKTTDVLVAELLGIPAGWTGRSHAGHGEFASDRSSADPNENMGNKRGTVSAIMLGGTTPPPPGDFMPDANVVSMSEAVYERIAWWVLWNYQLPWVDPQTGKPDNPNHKTTTVGATTAWVEEFTRRWSQEGADKVIAAMAPAAFASAIKAAVAESGLNVDEAELAREIIAQLSRGPAGAPALAANPEFDAIVTAAPQGLTAADVDDVPPRSSEAENDKYEGNDVSADDQKTERELGSPGS